MQRHHARWGWGLAVLLAGIGLATPGHANLVQNPGFEADDTSAGPVSPPTGWLATGDAGADNAFPHSGSNDGFLSFGTLQQAVSTSPGAVYSFSFWVAVDDAGTLFDGNAAFGAALNGADQFGTIAPGDLGLGSYVQYSTSYTATSSTTTLTFSGTTTEDTGIFYLDDVAFSPATTPVAVPEPASLLLFGTGLLGCALVRKRA